MGLRRAREDRHGAGIAFDALDLAKKIKPDQAKAGMKGLRDNGEDEGKVLCRQIEEFLESLGEDGASAGRLKDARSFFRRWRVGRKFAEQRNTSSLVYLSPIG
jgi:hypothetical protein